MVAVREVLCATDIEKPARTALRYSFFLAEQFHCPLHVMYAHGGEEAPRHDVYVPKAQRLQESLGHRRLRERLDNLVRAVPTAATGRATTHIIDGKLPEAVLDCSERQRADLIVLGSHPATMSADERPIIAEQLTNRTLCPVITVPTHDVTPAPRLQRILLPLQHSTSAGPVLDWAAYFARSFGAVIELLYLRPPAAADAPPNSDRQYEVKEALRVTGVAAVAAAGEHSGFADSILARIERGNCDLIVMASDLWDEQDQHVLARVRRRSAVPILSVRRAAPDRLFVDSDFEGRRGARRSSLQARAQSF